MKLGKIKQVALREIWKHEATNFTKWLAIPENLELLGEELDLDLSLIDTEYGVGRFNVDIYAEETGTGRKVIIENQLEKTDHDHLGKVITYASGLDAEIIIWIVKKVQEEHQQAIEWLNENTNNKINFFAIRMEVWKIGNSDPAPKFQIVSKPNDWTKSIKQKVNNESLTPIKELQLEFWNGFKEYALSNNLNLRLRKTYPQHWYSISFGRSDCHVELTINSVKKELSCEIWISDSKETFHEFKNHKTEIEQSIPNLKWLELPTKKASRIKVTHKGDLKKKDSWPFLHKWLGDNAVLFQDTFNKF